MKKRPTGLTIFAVINFVFAGTSLLSLLVTVGSPALREQARLSLSAYTILSPLLTAALLLISGVGFLKLSYRAGFVCGVAFCVLALGNILAFNALRGFNAFILHIPSMIYPILLLLMLVLRYRDSFSPGDGTTEQHAAPLPSEGAPSEGRRASRWATNGPHD